MKIVGDDGLHKVCECLVCGGAEWIAWNEKFKIADLMCRDCFESYKRGRYRGLALWASLLGKEELGAAIERGEFKMIPIPSGMLGCLVPSESHQDPRGQSKRREAPHLARPNALS